MNRSRRYSSVATSRVLPGTQNGPCERIFRKDSSTSWPNTPRSWHCITASMTENFHSFVACIGIWGSSTSSAYTNGQGARCPCANRTASSWRILPKRDTPKHAHEAPSSRNGGARCLSPHRPSAPTPNLYANKPHKAQHRITGKKRWPIQAHSPKRCSNTAKNNLN